MKTNEYVGDYQFGRSILHNIRYVGGYRNGIRKDAGKEGTLRSDIGYIKSSVDDLKGEQRNFNQLHYSLAERVGRVEESAKSAHRRIDGIEEKIR